MELLLYITGIIIILFMNSLIIELNYTFKVVAASLAAPEVGGSVLVCTKKRFVIAELTPKCKSSFPYLYL